MAEHPLLEYVNPEFRAYWLQAERGEERTNEGVRAELTDQEIASLEYFASVEQEKWVEILHEEGVLVLAGVDAPNPGMFQGYSLHDELRHMVERAGMSNYEALKTATVNPAIYWKIEGERGVIAPGAEADLILVEKNPLEDISNTKTIRGVMTDGRWLDRAQLDKLLEEVRDPILQWQGNLKRAPSLPLDFLFTSMAGTSRPRTTEVPKLITGCGVQ